MLSDSAKMMTIGQVAKLAGVGVETIRFYEREGLLDKPRRRQSGYRVFPPEVVGRIRFIKTAKQLGFSLKEIRELLDLRVDPKASVAEVKKHVDAKIDQIDSRLKDLNRVRSALIRVSTACNGKGLVSECTILEALESVQNIP